LEVALNPNDAREGEECERIPSRGCSQNRRGLAFHLTPPWKDKKDFKRIEKGKFIDRNQVL